MTDVAEFIFREMITNKDSDEAKEIAKDNATFDALIDDEPIMAVAAKKRALEKWGAMVASGRKWDHKGPIRRIYLATEHFDPVSEKSYPFDIWSNIHYGYVGSKVGFSADVLLTGAGAAQTKTIVNQALKGKLGPLEDAFDRFSKAPFGDKIKGIDPDPDQAAIQLGIDLWKTPGDSLSLSDLVSEVRKRATALIQ